MTPNKSITVDFFVSYTAADRQWAEWIAWQLEENGGYSTRLQAWDFEPGSNFMLEMQTALATAQRTIAVLSPAYLDSAFCAAEWAATLRRDPTGAERKLLLVRVQPCAPEGLLGPIVYVDLVDRTADEAAAALLNGIRAGRAKPTSSPRFPSSGSRPSVASPPAYPPVQPRVSAAEIPFAVSEADITHSGRPDLLVQNFVGAHGTRLRVFHWDARLHDLVQIAELQSGTPWGFRAEDIDGDGVLELVSVEADFSQGHAYFNAPRIDAIRRWNGEEYVLVAKHAHESDNVDAVARTQDTSRAWMIRPGQPPVEIDPVRGVPASGAQPEG